MNDLELTCPSWEVTHFSPTAESKRFRCEVLGGFDSGQFKSVKRESGLGRKSEQLADELSLADHISFGQPSYAPLPDHVHGFDPCMVRKAVENEHPTAAPKAMNRIIDANDLVLANASN